MRQQLADPAATSTIPQLCKQLFGSHAEHLREVCDYSIDILGTEKVGLAIVPPQRLVRRADTGVSHSLPEGDIPSPELKGKELTDDISIVQTVRG